MRIHVRNRYACILQLADLGCDLGFNLLAIEPPPQRANDYAAERIGEATAVWFEQDWNLSRRQNRAPIH